MPNALVIVESPAKAKTINKFLGRGYTVKASMGHVRDLPKREMGVDEEDFTPTYTVLDEKKKTLGELRKAAKRADDVYLASDPDREGEAICWHLKEELQKDSGASYIRLIEEQTEQMGIGRVVSVIGRFWSLDREGNWDRIEKTYRLLAVTCWEDGDAINL